MIFFIFLWGNGFGNGEGFAEGLRGRGGWGWGRFFGGEGAGEEVGDLAVGGLGFANAAGVDDADGDGCSSFFFLELRFEEGAAADTAREEAEGGGVNFRSPAAGRAMALHQDLHKRGHPPPKPRAENSSDE